MPLHVHLKKKSAKTQLNAILKLCGLVVGGGSDQKLMFLVDIKHLHKYVKNIVYVGILYNLDGGLVNNILIWYCFVSEVEKMANK